MLSEIRTQQTNRFNKNLVKIFSAVNATAGTGLAEAVKTAFAATAAQCVLRNGAARGIIRPKYLRTTCTVAPASGTAAHLRIAIDSGATRVSSGGTAITGRNRDMSSAVATNATFTFGAVVTAAATANVRYVVQASPSVVIPVVGDEFLLTFDDGEGISEGHGTVAGTTARRIVTNVGPVVLGPLTEMIVHTWYPSNATTPASWEVEACWEETVK